jgi:purine nucleosidase
VIEKKLIHLDTDLGSDTDDLCALALLLGWPDVELVGVTTSTDPGGKRAGMTAYALEVAGRSDVPVVAGAEHSIAGLFVPLAFPDHWPEPIPPRPAPAGAAIDLIARNIEMGATIVATGPYTNLAMLEAARPGMLERANLILMGGHVTTPRDGLPRWGVNDDFNLQQDRMSAWVVLKRCAPIIVPLAVCLEVHLRMQHVDRLRAAGPLGKMLADQAEKHALENGRTELGRAFPGLPDDLLNLHYDPLAAAVAAGWDGVTIEEIPTELRLGEDRLWMSERRGAPLLRCVTGVKAREFEEQWLRSVERVGISSAR